VKEDVAENRAKEANVEAGHKPAPDLKEDEDKSKAIEEIVGEIPRPDSEVTSNSPEKKPQPAEHIDLDKTA